MLNHVNYAVWNLWTFIHYQWVHRLWNRNFPIITVQRRKNLTAMEGSLNINICIEVGIEFTFPSTWTKITLKILHIKGHKYRWNQQIDSHFSPEYGSSSRILFHIRKGYYITGRVGICSAVNVAHHVMHLPTIILGEIKRQAPTDCHRAVYFGDLPVDVPDMLTVDSSSDSTIKLTSYSNLT